MANEFQYKVYLSIVHPTADPKIISAQLTEFHPRIETMAGTDRRGKGGKLLQPVRKALLTHWSADLHDEERLYSGTRPISVFLLGQLEKLKKHHDFLRQLRHEGEIKFVIAWFAESNCSAEVFTAEALKNCGELGIDIELHHYGIPQS